MTGQSRAQQVPYGKGKQKQQKKTISLRIYFLFHTGGLAAPVEHYSNSYLTPIDNNNYKYQYEYQIGNQ